VTNRSTTLWSEFNKAVSAVPLEVEPGIECIALGGYAEDSGTEGLLGHASSEIVNHSDSSATSTDPCVESSADLCAKRSTDRGL